MDQGNTLTLGSTKDSFELMIFSKMKLVTIVVCFTPCRCRHGMERELNLTKAGHTEKEQMSCAGMHDGEWNLSGVRSEAEALRWVRVNEMVVESMDYKSLGVRRIVRGGVLEKVP